MSLFVSSVIYLPLSVMLKVSPTIKLFLLLTHRHVRTQTGHTCARAAFGEAASEVSASSGGKWWVAGREVQVPFLADCGGP